MLFNLRHRHQQHCPQKPSRADMSPDMFVGKDSLATEPIVILVQPLRQLPVPIKDKVIVELRKLCDDGSIAPVNQPLPWISTLLVVRKQNGDIRICIDPKPLNRALKRDHFCMPMINDKLPQLIKAKVF